MKQGFDDATFQAEDRDCLAYPQFPLTLRSRIRSTHSSRLQMAGFVDMKEIQAKSTRGEF